MLEKLELEGGMEFSLNGEGCAHWPDPANGNNTIGVDSR